MTSFPIRYLWQWEVDNSPDEVWSLIADSTKLCRAMGLKPWDPGHANASDTQSSRGRRGLLLNSLSIAEAPSFTWVQERVLEVDFVLYSHLVESIRIRIDVKVQDSQTVLLHHVEVRPHSLIGKLAVPFLVGKLVKENLQATYASIAKLRQTEESKGFIHDASLIRPNARSQIDAFSEHVHALDFRENCIQAFLRLLSYAPDSKLEVIEPIAIAGELGLSVRRALELLAWAAHHQLLELRWRVRCPRCMEVRYSKSMLQNVPSTGSCSACEVQYAVDLSKNVELAFTPEPAVRALSKNTHNAIDPLSARHEVLHLTLAPESTSEQPLVMAPGRYRIRTPHTKPHQWYNLEVPPEKHLAISISIYEGAFEVTSSTCSGTHLVKLENHTTIDRPVVIESVAWRGDILTASQAITNQTFRTALPQQVVAPNTLARAGKFALLIADIPGFSSIFQFKGDEACYHFAREFYQFMEKHIREYEGAIVQHGADHIMAAFVNPVKALSGALQILESIDTFNATLSEDEQLSIRFALHYGSCLATNSNQLLDLFGYTVHFANSMQQCGDRDDIFLLSDEIWRIPEIKSVLEKGEHVISPLEATPPGQTHPVRMYELS